MGKKGVMSLLHSSFMRVSELLNPREIFFRKKPSHHFMSLHSWHFWHYYSNPFSSYFAFSCSFDDHGNHGCSRKRSIFVGKSTSNAAVTINSQKNQINFVIYVPFAYGNFLINVAVVDGNSTAKCFKSISVDCDNFNRICRASMNSRQNWLANEQKVILFVFLGRSRNNAVDRSRISGGLKNDRKVVIWVDLNS